MKTAATPRRLTSSRRPLSPAASLGASPANNQMAKDHPIGRSLVGQPFHPIAVTLAGCWITRNFPTRKKSKINPRGLIQLRNAAPVQAIEQRDRMIVAQMVNTYTDTGHENLPIIPDVSLTSPGK